MASGSNYATFEKGENHRHLRANFRFQICCFISKRERLKVDWVDKRRQILHFSPSPVKCSVWMQEMYELLFLYQTWDRISDVHVPLTHRSFSGGALFFLKVTSTSSSIQRLYIQLLPTSTLQLFRPAKLSSQKWLLAPPRGALTTYLPLKLRPPFFLRIWGAPTPTAPHGYAYALTGAAWRSARLEIGG